MGNQKNVRESVSELEALFGGRDLAVTGLDDEYRIEIQNRPPCNQHCPAGVNAKAYVNLIVARRYEDAFDVISQNCTFPGVCGRICTHPCEEFCNLKEVGSVPIKELKRFVADYKYSHVPGGIYPPKTKEGEEHIRLGQRIAIVGSGPAGCTAALDLGGLGYNVTLFEHQISPGGMLSQGIPDYRLPKKVVNKEIENIRSYGVNIETSRKIDSADHLRNEGFDVMILAAGTMRDLKLPIKGIEKKGVISCMPFLRDVNRGSQKELKGTVLVIGGGSSAFDCARVAKRLGAEKVSIAYRRTMEEMPAMTEEIKEAEEEDIEIMELSVPVRILGKDTVSSMEFLKAELGETDESGRRRPIPIEGTEFQLKADWIITAVGFTSDISYFSKDLKLSEQGTVEADSQGRTSVKDIFAAGDVVLGPSSVIQAIASGHDAAHGVHMMLSNEKGQPVSLREMPVVMDEPLKQISKTESNHLDPKIRECNFQEVNLGFSENMALGAAARCIRCASCFDCAVCLGECGYKQVSGTINGTSFLIKCPIGFSKKVYESPNEVTFTSNSKDQKVRLQTLTAKVDSGYCIACGRCEESCGYRAVTVKIKMDEPQAAYVDHDACKCCGACTAVCPTGAISQGLMSPEKVRENIHSLARNNEPLIFGCIWSKKTPFISDADIMFMCTRMIRPTMLLEALAQGISGIIINPCSVEEGCHYFPYEPSIEDIVCRTNDIMDYLGLTQERITIRRFPAFEKEYEIEDFSKKLKERGVQPISHFPFEGDNRIERSLKWLIKIQGQDSKDETVGGLAMLHMFFNAEGFNVLDEIACSVEVILENRIDEKDMAQIPIKSVLDKINIPDSIAKEVTIALVPSSVNGLDPAHIQNILSSSKGLNIIIIEPQEDIDFNKLTSRTKVQALELFKEAERKCADVLVPLSILDLAQLKLLSRTGSWQTTKVMVKDIFSVLIHLSSEWGGWT